MPRRTAATRRRQRRGAEQQQQPDEQRVTIIIDDDDSDTDDHGGAGAEALHAPAAPSSASRRSTRQQQQDDGDGGGSPGGGTRAAAGAAAADAAVPAAPPPELPAAAAGVESDGDDDPSSSCIICMELMAEQGGHRPAALKCGHIMGMSCIQRWLREKSRCPQCNKPAKARDITALFNLPKRVAAGAGAAAAAELEQQLQRAQSQAQREAQRAQQLERQLQTMQQQLNQQHQQQQQLGYGGGGGCSAPVVGPLYNDPTWPLQFARWTNNELVGPELAAFLAHPNTVSLTQPPLQPMQPLQPLQPPLQHQQGMHQPPLQQQAHMAQQQQQQSSAWAGHKRSWEPSAGPAAAGAGAGGRSRPSNPTSTLPPAAAAAAAATARAAAASAAAAAPAEVAPQQQAVAQLCLLPVGPSARGASGSSSAQQRQQSTVQMRGRFEVIQEYELTGSRAFDFDVAGTLLTVAEAPAASNASNGCSRLRRISMLTPGSPAYIYLPSNAGVVRCLVRQALQSLGGTAGSALLAAGTDRGGLLIAKPSTNNIIATVPTQAPVWSVAWSSRNEQQLLLGLAKGRVALVDLRMTGSRALLFESGAGGGGSSSAGGSAGGGGAAAGPSAAPAPPSQPWHSVVMLSQECQQQLLSAGVGLPGGGAAAAADEALPEALLASPAGVHCWSSAQPDSFQLLLPSSWHGGQCESLVMAPGGTLAASFRQSLAGNAGNLQPPPAHWLAQLAPAAAPAAAAAAAAGQDGVSGGMAAGQQQLLSSTLQLWGHSSKQSMTRACFMPALPGLPSESLLLASADELSCEPRLWDCSSGAMLTQQQPWQRMSSPVLQLAGGNADAFGAVLLGALSERQLKVYSYQHAVWIDSR